MRTAWIVSGLLFLTSLTTSSVVIAAEFTRIINCGDTANIRPCTFSSLERGRKVTLLNARTAKTCAATASGYSKFKGGLDEGATVTLLDVKKCAELHQYWLGILDIAISEYKHISLRTVHDEKLTRSVDKKLRSLNLRSQKDDKSFGHGLSSKPLLFKPLNETGATYLAHYVVRNPNRPDELVGPLFFYSKDGTSVGTIASEAVISHFFKLNGKSYLVYEHICWAGCDNTYTGIAEQVESGFVVLFKG